MPCIKKDAPPELVEAIRQIEERADECFRSLKLLSLQSNVVLWSLLVGGIKLVEQEIAKRGDSSQHLDNTLLNVSRFIPVAMKWALEHGKRASKLASRRWSPNLSAKVSETLTVAHNYSTFLTCLPMWHKHRYAAELISPSLVRFTVPGSSRDRQVSAYQKGFRPREGTYKGQRATKPEQSQRVQQLFEQVFQVCRKTGTVRFEYDNPWPLWRELLPQYQAAVAATVRRADGLSLGDYTLSDFKQFYSALMSVCAAHEFLCFAWGKNYHLYPVDSAVLVRPLPTWTAILSKLSGLSPEKCRFIIGDLTFDFTRSLDLHVHPFVPLDSSTLSMALAPQFPLHSRLDENILRVCSMRRRDVFDATSLEKEPEMLAALQQMCSQYSVVGPISLPQPLPDIDLLIADGNSSTIVIAELKWNRKTNRPVELIDRDAEIVKGISQLGQIRQFLTENPSHLDSQVKLPKSTKGYANVHYLLVARDHWLWVEPAHDIAIIEFEALSAAVGRTPNLHAAVTDLLNYGWLPVEGRDFTVRYDRSTVNGVSIESEVFYLA
jgi:hypothetical protein